MTRHWGDFLHSYVLPLLKSLQAQGPGKIELSLVVYYTRSSYRYSGLSDKKSLSCQLPSHNKLTQTIRQTSF